MCMMLGYVHNTTKIWRIWDFNSGRTGRAVECSNVVFDEEENAHTEEQRVGAIEFPENADESQDEIQEVKMNEISDGRIICQESKSRNLVPVSELSEACQAWAEACRFGQMPAGLGRSLPGWAEACRFGQKPAGLGRCLLSESMDDYQRTGDVDSI